jgi:uncharacterized repeat protein (TIGR03803 family)
MTPSAFSRYVLRCAASALLAGCGGSQPPIGAPGAMPQNTTRANAKLTYYVLYGFGAAPDGNDPGAGVIGLSDDGTFYGTTIFGGAYSCSPTYRCGTVFSIATGGTETVLHSFTNENDGANPEAELVDVGGTLYGTTFSGGYGFGVVFSITPEGVEKVLHSFGNGTDGRNPHAGLIDVGGRLYGTTEFGGKHNRGTIFSITTAGIEKVLHSFGKPTDGSQPLAHLVRVGSTLYGTTGSGGAYTCGRYRCGTVFSVTTDGMENVLHSFNGTDGQGPTAGLLDVSGTLYGTTSKGGAYTCAGVPCGTVFSITTGGVEKVLHSFNGTDGEDPAAGLLDVSGTLYGTTYLGGEHTCDGVTCGTVFRITTRGAEKVLHSFAGGSDGALPLAGLIKANGALYGATSLGGGGSGCSGNGCGTVFSMSP